MRHIQRDTTGSLMTAHIPLTEMAQRIPDGAFIAIPPEYSFVPMELVRGLIRRRITGLRVLCVPIGGMAVDMLIGAGCVSEVEAAAVSLGESGPAPQFTQAVVKRTIKMTDSTCPALHTGLQATEKGVPFMPLGGIIGSDLVAHRNDWRVVEDPLGNGNGPILLIPALQPDITVFHSPLADRKGNVWVGRRRELVTMAHAARQTLVTVERVTDQDLLADEKTAAGTLPALYVSAISEAPDGAKPLGLTDCYTRNEAAISDYASLAKTEQGFQKYLDQFIDPVPELATP